MDQSDLVFMKASYLLVKKGIKINYFQKQKYIVSKEPELAQKVVDNV